MWRINGISASLTARLINIRQLAIRNRSVSSISLNGVAISIGAGNSSQRKQRNGIWLNAA